MRPPGPPTQIISKLKVAPDSTVREITSFDDGMLEQIASLVDVPHQNRDPFKQELRGILNMAHGGILDLQCHGAPTRGELIRRFDALIAALEVFGSNGLLGIFAAAFFFAGEPGSGTNVLDNGMCGQRYIAELIEKARRAKQIVTKTKLLRGRGSPRGSRVAPGLDMVLILLYGTMLRHGARRLTASKSNRKSGVAVMGTIVEVLRLVAPCFHRNFLPRSDATLLNAINRARRAVAAQILPPKRANYWGRAPGDFDI
jgi:hypothetical protein